MTAPRRGVLGAGRPGEHPPGPRNYPIIGVRPVTHATPLDRFTAMLAEHGDVAYYRVGDVPLYVLGYPDDIAAVLVGEHQRYMKDEITHELAGFIGRGLVTSEGAFWRRQRRLAAPTFARRHIEVFADTMVRVAAERFDAVPPGVRDVHVDMMTVTLDIVLRTLFGEADLPDVDEVGRVVTVAMDDFARMRLSWRRLLPQWVFGASAERMAWARQSLDRILYGIIEERRARGTEGDDLLGRFLAARDDDGSSMTDRQLRDEVATMFLAGTETTALALSYAVWLLARHPAAQRRLHDEVDETLRGRAPTLEDLPRLRYADAVVREAMRLYPPAYVIGREALEACTIAGFVVPRGAQILMPQWVVHRDDRWYDDPERFFPERWLDGLAERLPRFAYFPFGGGPRICVGNHFAMLEAVLALAMWAQRYAVTPDPTFELALAPSVTLRPAHGVRVRVAPRDPDRSTHPPS